MFQDVIKILISIPDTCNSASRAQEQKLGPHTIIQIALNIQVFLKCVNLSDQDGHIESCNSIFLLSCFKIYFHLFWDWNYKAVT